MSRDLLVPAVLAVLGALVALVLARWLRARTYRLEEEQDFRTRRVVWWMAPALAALWAGLGWRFGAEGEGIVLTTYLLFAVLAAALVAIDLDVHRLPDMLVLPSYPALMVLLGACSWMIGDWGAWIRALLACVVLLAGYFLLALFSPGGGGLGLGDVKLAGLIGLALGWLGWGPVVVALYAGFISGGVLALVMLVTRRVGLKGDLAYGPPMLLGAFAGLLLPTDWLSRFLLG